MELDNELGAAGLSFPLFVFFRDVMALRYSEDELTRSTAHGLQKGRFNEALLVDLSGRSRRVTTAAKIRGLGWLRGWNLFLNQRIRVRLHFAGAESSIEVDEVGRLILEDFRRWPGWRSRGDYKELVASVKSAQTIAELFRLVEEPRAPSGAA